MFFFIGVAIKIAISVSWHTTPVSLCWSNDLQLEIRKRHSYLENAALDFVFLVLKLYTIHCYLTPILDKTYHGLFIVLFSEQLMQLFQLRSRCTSNHSLFTVMDWLVYFGYSANYNTREAALFLICCNLLNCLRSVGIMAVTTESGLNSLKVIFTEQFLTNFPKERHTPIFRKRKLRRSILFQHAVHWFNVARNPLHYTDPK